MNSTAVVFPRFLAPFSMHIWCASFSGVPRPVGQGMSLFQCGPWHNEMHFFLLSLDLLVKDNTPAGNAAQRHGNEATNGAIAFDALPSGAKRKGTV